MIVLAQLLRLDPPAARHAEVEHHRLAAIGMNQAVLGSAGQASNRSASQNLDQFGREWTAQPGPAGGYPVQALAIEIAREASHGGFNFG